MTTLPTQVLHRRVALRIAAIALGIGASFLAAAADAPAPIRVVFDRVTFVEPGAEPTNTRIVAWRDGLTAVGAILAAGGYTTPPTRRAKIIRGGTDIPLDLNRLSRGGSDIALQPGDTLFLY